MNMDIIEAYKRGDRAGLSFEGKLMWLDIPEWRVEMALKSSRGSDESSIVDCFLAYVDKHPWNGDLDGWLWGWLVYHQQHHGTGYGKTYRDHFNLVALLNKKRPDYTVEQKLAKVREIADEVKSFGNACLALVYPLYQYASTYMPEYSARDMVLWFTRHSHTNLDAYKTVHRLIDVIDGDHIDSPGEDYIRHECCAEHATAWNTLMTAAFIADVETEDELYRRGIWVGGDADSTMATAGLLWALKQIEHEGKNTGNPNPIGDAATCMFWMPIEPGYRMQLSDDYAIVFTAGQHLPVFLSGEEMDRYKETTKVAMTPHTILMGALLGYNDMTYLPDEDQERVFLADTIRNLTQHVFKKDDLGDFLLDAAHWLRTEVGLSHGRTALKTAMQLAPFNMSIRTDYISMSWYQAEDESDEKTRHDLLEEIVGTYQKFSMNELPELFLNRTSYFFCAALGILGRHTLPGDREWYDHAIGCLDHPVPLEKLEQCQREGFSMDACKTVSV